MKIKTIGEKKRDKNGNEIKKWTVIEEKKEKSGDLLLIKVWSGEITIAIHWKEDEYEKKKIFTFGERVSNVI